MAERRILTWKYEDGPEDAPLEGSPDDVGPAWIDTMDGEKLVSSEKANDGEWLTRAEAQQLAERNGYVFSADDGSPWLESQ